MKPATWIPTFVGMTELFNDINRCILQFLVFWTTVGGPLEGGYNHTADEAECNCEHLEEYFDDPAYYAMCFQSREFARTAQKEAWAFFYGAALFNQRETNCGMAYFRPMYVVNSQNEIVVDDDTPVKVNCAVNPKWMETHCDDEDEMINRGTAQDWIGFFWDIWTEGDEKFTINEITDIWEETGDYTYWDDLYETVSDEYENDPLKVDFFEAMGRNAGVIH